MSNLKKVFLIIITYFIKFVKLFAFFPEKTPILPGFGANLTGLGRFGTEFAQEAGKWGPRSIRLGPYAQKPARSTRIGPYGVNSRLRRPEAGDLTQI